MTAVHMTASTSLFGDSSTPCEMYAHVHDWAKLAEHLPPAMETTAMMDAIRAANAGGAAWASDLYNRTVAETRAGDAAPTRYEQTNRTHDLPTMAERLGQWLGEAKRLREHLGMFRTPESTRKSYDIQAAAREYWLRDAAATNGALLSAVEEVARFFEAIVHVMATRWPCVMSAILQHTPGDQRERLKAELARHGAAVLEMVGGLHDVYGGPAAELARMHLGPGHVEMALRAFHALTLYAIDRVLSLSEGAEASHCSALQASARSAERMLSHQVEQYLTGRRDWMAKMFTIPTDASRPGIEGVVMQLHERVPEVLAQRLQGAGRKRFEVNARK